jgi:hypothetical protein
MGWKSVPKGGGGDKKAASQLCTNKSAQQTAEQLQIASKICTACDLGRPRQGRNMVTRVHKYNVMYINTVEETRINRGRTQKKWCGMTQEMSDGAVPYISYECKCI